MPEHIQQSLREDLTVRLMKIIGHEKHAEANQAYALMRAAWPDSQEVKDLQLLLTTQPE